MVLYSVDAVAQLDGTPDGWTPPTQKGLTHLPRLQREQSGIHKDLTNEARSFDVKGKHRADASPFSFFTSEFPAVE